jgi:HD-like signal output (HDOD) protein
MTESQLDEHAFLTELQEAIRHDRITLPTLPEVALRVRDAMTSQATSAADIACIIATDAALSARLLQVANSPLYRGHTAIDSVQLAVARLGVRLVRYLVVSLATQGMFQARSHGLNSRFRRLWERSVQVAAIARVLAKPLPHLEPDQAMLAGLIHEIGALPILVQAERIGLSDERALERLLERFSPRIGRLTLEHWDFPPSLIAVTEHFNELDYDGGPEADYVDVVIVARLESLMGTDHPDATRDWSQVRAFEKLGLAPDIEIVELEGAEEEMHDVNEMFLG